MSYPLTDQHYHMSGLDTWHQQQAADLAEAADERARERRLAAQWLGSAVAGAVA